MSNAITGQALQLYPFLSKELNNATEVKFVVSFLMESGVKLIIKDLKKLSLKGIPIKILTGTYLNITQPSAIYLLKSELGENVDIRFYSDKYISFHPKTYIIHQGDSGVIFIGSSNISKSALTSGIEWNYRLSKDSSLKDFIDFDNSFDDIFNNYSKPITNEELKNYALNWRKHKIFKSNNKLLENIKEPSPVGAQIEALYELKSAREEGIDKGIVVAATGIGKTYLSAFDSKHYRRILFVAHRKEILIQAQKTFRNVRKDSKTSIFDGDNKDNSGNIIFASVQTLGKEEYLTKDYFDIDHFDYIIIDEFHHAAANSYKRIINYFKPKFLLGLTATPYRMDNKDIYELCDDNVIYEINLKSAINRDLLVPFKYYGIYDDTDYNNIDYKNGKYNTEELEIALSTHKRCELVLEKYLKFRGKRVLGFCSSIKHAENMAKYFNDNNIKSVIVHSGESSEYKMDRNEAISKLENKEIEIIFTVDIFNEGVDIPSLDTVLFLRPTESYVVFLQQLGRGLRKYKDKNYLNVLDFIGNYKRAHYIPKLLSGENPINSKKDYSRINEMDYPDDCYVNFDFKLIDLFDELRRNDPLKERMKVEYFRLKNYLGRRPLRKDIYEGIDINIKEYLREGYLKFLQEIDELNKIEESWIGTIAEEFLIEIEKTSMAKSYKIPTLMSFIKDDNIKSKVTSEEVGIIFMNYYKNNKLHQKDLNNKRHNDWENWSLDKFINEAVRNPIKYLSNKKFFNYDEINKEFCLKEDLHKYLDNNLKLHFEDILKYRNTDYFRKRFKEDN